MEFFIELYIGGSLEGSDGGLILVLCRWLPVPNKVLPCVPVNFETDVSPKQSQSFTFM